MYHRAFPQLILALALVSGASTPAPAQGAAGELPRTEVWGGLTIVGPGTETTLATSYTPVIRNFVSAGQAGQELQLDAATQAGFELGASYFPVRHAGLQVLVGHDRFDLSGLSSPYVVHLEYTALFPPSYAPTPVVVDRSESWPDAAGDADQWTVCVNGVGRWSLGLSVRGQLSGGLTYVRMKAAVRPLGYSSFQLGGHSVLFSNLYELELSTRAASSLGFNAGGGLDIRLSPRLWLTTDLRYVNGGTVSAPLEVVEILNPSEVMSADPLTTIQGTMRPAPLELGSARVRLMVGIKSAF